MHPFFQWQGVEYEPDNTMNSNDPLPAVIDESLPLETRQPDKSSPCLDAAMASMKRDGLLPMTPAQARVDAVAALTSVALSKAGTLQLTPDETERLTAPFADSDFLPGAAGKEHLIYCQHSALRDRLNKVLGLGQWALIVRESWNEDFETQKGVKGTRVYVRAMMLVRGCYVGEVVGDMDYYPGNAAQNYGDAFEGAKTAAFRRCAKEFGVGVQAWDKHWCDGWWARKRDASRPATPARPAPTPAPKPAAPAKPLTPDERRQTLFAKLKGFEPEMNAIFREEGLIMENEVFTDLTPLTVERMTPDQMLALIKTVKQRKADNDQVPGAEVEDEANETTGPEDRSWENAVLPFTSPKNPDAVKGMTLKELFENPKTSKYAFGLAMNFKAEPRTAANGKVYQPSQADVDFAEGCALWREQHQDKRD